MDNQTASNIGILDQFQNEFIEFWNRLPNKGFFFALLAVWCLLFQFFGNATLGYVDTPSLFRWMYSVYQSRDLDGNLKDDSIGFWIPIVFLALCWWKRGQLISEPLKIWWPGLLICAGGMVLHVAGFFTQQPKISIVAMLIGVYGLMGMTWGREWLVRIFFPFFLLVFLVPFSSLVEPITFPLRLLVSRIVEIICHFVLAIDVVRDGTILMDPAGKYHYEVAAACSGIRSFVAIGLMATVGAFVFFKQWWRRCVLLALIIPLAVAGNVLRLLTIIMAADFAGQEAGSYVHEGGPGGIISLLPYVPAIFGLMYAGRWLEEPKPEEPKSTEPKPT
jgi:exosortase